MHPLDALRMPKSFDSGLAFLTFWLHLVVINSTRDKDSWAFVSPVNTVLQLGELFPQLATWLTHCHYYHTTASSYNPDNQLSPNILMYNYIVLNRIIKLTGNASRKFLKGCDLQ